MLYDVAVIGLGGMGSAVAATCARRGLRTIGIEQFSPAHAQGSSHGKTRLIRQAYFEHPAYVPLLLRSYELWRELQAECGTELLRITGLVMAGLPGCAVVSGSLASARQHALAVEALDAREMRARFPMLRPRDDEVGVYEPEGGIIFPERTVSLMIARARDAGADLRFDTRLRDWDDPAGETIALHFEDGTTINASRVVFALGAWFSEQGARLGLPLRVQRNVQAWFTPGGPGFTAEVMPAFLIERDTFPAMLYGMPDLGDGVKAAFHRYGEMTTPQQLRRRSDERDIEPVAAALNEWIPGAASAYRDAAVCMYESSADEHFAIGFHADDQRVVIAGGFSGHGFKFVPIVGEIVADLVQYGGTKHDIGFLSMKRLLHG